MSGRVVFLLEEPSMKAFLQEFLPRLVPGWQHERDFLLVPHEGKSDLEKSIPRKLKAWREPGVRFVVVRDNDHANCLDLKQRLLTLAQGHQYEVLIRLVCQELEAWYLADPNALSAAYPGYTNQIQRLARRFSNPDVCPKPSRVLRNAIPAFQKQDAARRMGRMLPTNSDCIRSASFRAFVAGVRRIADTLRGEPI